MTTHSIPFSIQPLFGATIRRLNAVLEPVLCGMAVHATRQDRYEEVKRLRMLDDADLARLGVARDAIVKHVFRDLLAD